MANWSVDESVDLYGLAGWGQGLFGVNEAGHVTVSAGHGTIDLHEVIEDLVARGHQLPMTVRLSDVIRARVERLALAFSESIKLLDYQAPYRGVFPIKVNQERHVVQEIVRFSEPFHMGLECGSKPELMVVIAYMNDPKALIVCNGYKDGEYIELALMSRQLGRNTIVVVEKMSDLDLVLALSEKLGVEPSIGVRVKMASRGTGRWQTSSGDRAKFGLTVGEVLTLVERLESAGKLDALQLLHFHVGSQISSLRKVRQAVLEGARIYTELVKLGAPMGYLDCGGGLGVDYDGTRTNYSSSMNYSLEGYASAVIETIRDVMDERGVPHPAVVTEAGRAMVAHGTVLVTPVLGTSAMPEENGFSEPDERDGAVVTRLAEVAQNITARNVTEAFREAERHREQTLLRFSRGEASLRERARVDEIFWSIVRSGARLVEYSEDRDMVLNLAIAALADTYYCNFSVFQSAPDSWAIKQVFPVMPLQRLNEQPTRSTVLVDLTCDSDGKIDRFVDPRADKRTLEVHAIREGEPYYLGVFLVGAYQEILGDLHNLFGDTHMVHIESAPTRRGYRVTDFVDGENVEDVLEYVSYDPKGLASKMREQVNQALDEGLLDREAGRGLIGLYRTVLDSYTYLG